MHAESDEQDDVASAIPEGPEASGVSPGGADAAGEPGGAESGRKAERALGSRAPAFIRASRPLHVSWQVGVFVVGLAVVAAGIVMLPLPGPGWLVIFGGMAIWATEFVWAQLVLRWTRRKVTEAAQKALDPKVRRRNIILTVVGLVIIAALLAVYLVKFGVVMPWKIDQ
ncbi:TIGR02611 family protein [Streptomyces sp. NPDC088725]|uniref:TIGR02611 family protein n=1 Tax=Streptomyces sp. NPDC088725 TaxID=3365873 RepID=UPI00380C3774